MTIAPSRTALLLVTAAIAVAAVLLVGWIPGWMGFGFDAAGPEMARLNEALALRAGMVVADVGAGKGQLTQALAGTVGPSGHVFSTDVDQDRVEALRVMLDQNGLRNVTTVPATARDSGLPDGCCDAIVMRRVYHHVREPAETNASLRRALRPGGLLAVIDLPPPPFLPRGSLGVPVERVVAEVTASGFEMLHLRSDWPGRGPLDSYCVVFRKPRQRD